MRDLKYPIAAKETCLFGRKYRSRLEAKWATFFSLMGWPFEYEALDLCGWIPDFVIYGTGAPVLVEVKPTRDHFEVSKYRTARDKSNGFARSEILLLDSQGPEIVTERMEIPVRIDGSEDLVDDVWSHSNCGAWLRNSDHTEPCRIGTCQTPKEGGHKHKYCLVAPWSYMCIFGCTAFTHHQPHDLDGVVRLWYEAGNIVRFEKEDYKASCLIEVIGEPYQIKSITDTR